MAPNQNRTRRVHMVMTQEEWEMAVSLAERKGLTVSDIVRLYIREEYARQAEKTASKKKR
jgi:hypothetical protein